jgi:murein L,D-transpeptidase YcbB/YkuD
MASDRPHREPLDVAALLTALGYGEAMVADLCDTPLREAVRRFQVDEGLVATGSLDEATLEAMADADVRRRRHRDPPAGG